MTLIKGGLAEKLCTENSLSVQVWVYFISVETVMSSISSWLFGVEE